MTILLDTSPLVTGHRERGIGMYTRQLQQALQELAAQDDNLTLLTAQSPAERAHHLLLADVIHYPYFDLFFNTLPAQSKKPVVVTIHDVIPLVFPAAYPPGLKGKLRFWQQRRRVQQVAAIITDSRCSQQDIITYLDVSAHQTTVVPLAANPALQPISEYYVDKYGAQFNLPPKYVLYIGDINYNKNIPTLLLALTQLPPDLQLVVISRTWHHEHIPEGQQIAQVIAANDLADRVRVLDIPGDQTEAFRSVVSGARCLVQPSWYEGFGLPVLEAMQIGTVVVSSNAASLPEVAGDAAILVEPTIAGLVSGVEQALKLRGEERQAWLARGWARAAQFSWESTARKTVAVYQQVMEGAVRA